MEFEQWLIGLPEVFLIEVFTPNIGGISISQVLTKPDTHDRHILLLRQRALPL